MTRKGDKEVDKENRKNISPGSPLNESYDPVTVKYILKQDSEIKLLVKWLLHKKLGVYAFLGTRYLEKTLRRNTMSILKTAKASMKGNI